MFVVFGRLAMVYYIRYRLAIYSIELLLSVVSRESLKHVRVVKANQDRMVKHNFQNADIFIVIHIN